MTVHLRITHNQKEGFSFQPVKDGSFYFKDSNHPELLKSGIISQKVVSRIASERLPWEIKLHVIRKSMDRPPSTYSSTTGATNSIISEHKTPWKFLKCTKITKEI